MLGILDLSGCGFSTGRSLVNPPPRRQGGVASEGELRQWIAARNALVIVS